MEKDWNLLDRIIAALRYAKVNRYVRRGSTVADIGCGREGAFLLSHSAKIARGYGFDFRIQTHDEGNISFICNKGLGGKIPLEDGSVDDVFLNAVLEHLEDPKGVLSEAARILKEGGRIIMTTPTRIAQPVLEFLSYRLHLINEDEIREHKHYFNKADIQEIIAVITPPLYKYTVRLERYAIFELGFNSLIVLRKELGEQNEGK